MQEKDILEKPLEQIRNEQDLLKAILHLYNLSHEANQREIDRWKENTAYSRGNHTFRAGSSSPIPNSRSKGMKTLQKDIIKMKIDNLSSLLSRGMPGVQIEALQPDQMAVLGANLIDATENTPAPAPLTAQYTSEVPAQVLQNILEGEWRVRKERVLQKKIIDEVLVAGVAFRSYSLKRDAVRGNKVYTKLLERDKILLDPQTTKLETFEDCRWMFLLAEMTASDIEMRWGVKEKDYQGTDAPTRMYSDTSGSVRMFSEIDVDGNVKQNAEMKTYPVFVLFWQPGQPDILRFSDGDKRERDRRGRMYAVVNKTKLVYNGFAQDLGGLYPVVAYSHDPIANTFSGNSVVSNLKGTQDFVNILYNTIAKNARLRGGYQFLAEPGAIKQKNFVLGSNMMIPVGVNALSQGKIQEMTPGDIGQSTANLMQQEIAYARELIGDPSGLLSGVAPTTVKSGKHASTILESSNTLIGQYIAMLDASHEHAAYVEALMIQKSVDVMSEYYSKRYRTWEVPYVDLAIAELEFMVEILSKSNLPSTSISAELTYFRNLYLDGAMNLYDYLKNTEQLDVLDPEWIERVQQISREAVPGRPPMLQAELDAQAEASAQQAVQGLSAVVGEGGAGLEGGVA